MTTIDKTVFLAAGEGPEPIWRDEAEDGATWPADAVFKLVFTSDAAGTSLERPISEFYGSDGWPADFPASRKHVADDVRRELQVCARSWRKWDDGDWRQAEAQPSILKRTRLLRAPVQALAARTSRFT